MTTPENTKPIAVWRDSTGKEYFSSEDFNKGHLKAIVLGFRKGKSHNSSQFRQKWVLEFLVKAAIEKGEWTPQKSTVEEEVAYIWNLYVDESDNQKLKRQSHFDEEDDGLMTEEIFMGW